MSDQPFVDIEEGHRVVRVFADGSWLEDTPAGQRKHCDMFRDDAWVELTTERDTLKQRLEAVLANPDGCPMCDGGRLRNANKEHWDDCPFLLARAALASSTPQEP